MSAAIIRDKIAVKLLNLADAKHVYSNGSTDSRIAPWPAEFIDDGPHVLVGRGFSRRSGGTGTQRMERGIIAEWRFSGLEKAQAERFIDSLEDQILVEFSSGITLGGSAINCWYDGSDRPFEEIDDGGRTWVVWAANFIALERFALDMTA